MYDEGVDLGSGVCIHETSLAVLVQLDDGKEPLWVPKSCVHDDSEVFEQDDEGQFVVLEWWAIEKRLA